MVVKLFSLPCLLENIPSVMLTNNQTKSKQQATPYIVVAVSRSNPLITAINRNVLYSCDMLKSECLPNLRFPFYITRKLWYLIHWLHDKLSHCRTYQDFSITNE